ncbi:MAG: 3'-5' exonuclease [Bacteroidota bacterium]
MATSLSDILFLDIETVPALPDHSLLPETMKKLWSRKAGWIRRAPSETDEQLYNTRAGIYAEFGRVIVIGTGRFERNEEGMLHFSSQVFHHHEEHQLLQSFRDHLMSIDSVNLRLCAHNGKEFDFPYLCRRMIINGIPLPPSLDLSGRKPWEVGHIDTLEYWKFGDHKQFTSMELLAEILGMPGCKSDMDGSMVRSVYYESCDLDRIARYCASDVRTLADVYLRLRGIRRMERLPLMPA